MWNAGAGVKRGRVWGYTGASLYIRLGGQVLWVKLQPMALPVAGRLLQKWLSCCGRILSDEEKDTAEEDVCCSTQAKFPRSRVDRSDADEIRFHLKAFPVR